MLQCWTTQVVLEELRQGAATYPALSDVLAGDWLKVAHLDTLDEVRLFAIWVSRIGSGERDLGEASVFAAAELRSATAITDDQGAVRVARTYGLDVHGTIWLLAGACRDGKLSERAAGSVVDALRVTEAEEMSRALQDRVTGLDGVLTTGIRTAPLVTFWSLKRQETYPAFDAGPLGEPLPPPQWEQFVPHPPSGFP